MGVRSGEGLPVPASRWARLGFGVLTFLVWYAGMLSGLSLVAMLTVRTVHDVGLMVVAMLAATGLLLWLRRLFLRAVLPHAPAALADGRTEKL